ncbi:WXG100 family type VII secretion target [Kineothrix alysoides]|uniref:WXG100 family type VII secretion target n=1 Tax=Kineothrix alysoides TaxID=1469948 RepID=A0A4R1R158_9FIRM|nr:WXG100 family type VII secretion target [Kineothrix alysoides]TCL59038.1 WXG100 family type VII secretion target [Kineothrix alysoides]
MAGIKFDYNKTINQAKELEDIASDMQNSCIKKMNEISGNVEAAWTGNAAKAYVKYIRGVQDDLGKKAKYLKDTAEFLRNAAKRMKEAEEAAKQMAQKI